MSQNLLTNLEINSLWGNYSPAARIESDSRCLSVTKKTPSAAMSPHLLHQRTYSCFSWRPSGSSCVRREWARLEKDQRGCQEINRTSYLWRESFSRRLWRYRRRSRLELGNLGQIWSQSRPGCTCLSWNSHSWCLCEQCFSFCSGKLKVKWHRQICR